MTIKLGSLFDGIGVFPLAAARCGITPVWASEIEKAPISITKRHFPDMAHLGDITRMDGGHPARPCADLWIAVSKPVPNRQPGRLGWRKVQPVFSSDPHYQRNEGCN